MYAIADAVAFLLAITPALCGGESPSSRADQIIAEWKNATRDVKSVRGSVEVIHYDESFRSISYGHGSFAYFQPRDGFWQLSSQYKSARGSKVGSFRVEEYSSTHFQWKGHYVRDIDDGGKSYSEWPIVEGQGWLFDHFLKWFQSVSSISPFLPGMPNKAVVDTWKIEVSDESATHVWLHGVPKTDDEKKHYSSCDLYIKKDSLALEAVQYTMPGDRERRVFMFKEVELNPASQEMPDLSGYKCTDPLPKEYQARQPSPEASKSE